MKALLGILIVCLTAVEITALIEGVNGVALSISVGALGGGIGFILNHLLKTKGVIK